VEATTVVDPKVAAPRSATVAVYGPHVLHYPIWTDFPRPIKLDRHKVVVEVEIPPSLTARPPVVVTMYAKDTAGRRQYTNWADGEASAGNDAFDPATRRLRLTVRPTPPSIDPQGSSDPGFDPSLGISSIGLEVHVSPLSEGGFREGTVRVRSIRVEDAPPVDMTPPIERPLLRSGTTPHPLRPSEIRQGVSRFFAYGDLHPDEQFMADQQRHGFDTFRLMGGFDVRSRNGHAGGPDSAQMAATEELIQTAERTGQKHLVISLFDGAIANDTLRKAMLDPAEGRRLVDAWRPFIHAFGNRQIEGQPVIFDLVNEIHGMGEITLRQRQRFVETLIDAFVEEAPGSTVTLGVASYKDLPHWTYLLDRCQGKPITFIPTFHVWEDFDHVPPAWDLAVPPGTTVGITEADPRAGMATIVKKAADKGYPWLLFWTDSEHPYSATAHQAAVAAAER
jgi:hypothetical protein